MTRFPDEFLFGFATSAYQIEGGIDNDWKAWESQGKLRAEGEQCGPATDHWNRWQDDFQRLSDIGVGAYRFSIEWARVEPEPGKFDQAALDQYSAMVDDLVARGIEPMVTLLHFTHPPWFHDLCPWHVGQECVERFARFAAVVANAIGDRVRMWTVLNEPSVWLTAAYLAGVVPPGRKSMLDLGAAFFNLVRAHAAAHRVLKTRDEVQIGVANNTVAFEPSGGIADRVAAGYIGKHYNHAFIKAATSGRAQLGLLPGIRMAADVPEAKGTLDFIGVNYYTRVFVEVGLSKVAMFYEDRSGNGVSDLGWELFPGGFHRALVDMKRHGLPIYITENGLDDRDDSRRSAFLYDHLQAVLRAMADGVDVRGYMFWSLLDNFEWLEGFGPRFGMHRVDYGSFERTPTKAVEVYRRIIRTRMLPDQRPEAAVRPGWGRVAVE